MKIILFLIISFLTLNFSNGQNTEIDSLTVELGVAKEDTNKVLLLNRLAYLLHRPNPDQGIQYARQSIELAEKLIFDKGRAHAYNSLGAGHWNIGELDSALKYYTKSYQLNDTLKNARGVTGALSNIAIIYEGKGEYIKAIDAYTRALNEMKANGFDSYAAITSNNLGMVLGRLGNYPEALKYYNYAIQKGEELEMTNLLGPAWINVGILYRKTGDLTKEIEAKQRALKIGQDAGDKYTIALSLNNLGRTFMARENYEEALKYHRSALKINQEVGRKTSVASNFNNIGELYRNLGQYDSALAYGQKALQLSEEIGHSSSIRRALYQTGLALKEFRGCNSSIGHLERGYALAKEKNDIDDVRDFSKHLFECYHEFRNYEKALFYQTAYMNARDSILNEENIKEMAEVEAQYQFEGRILTQQNEINLLEAKEEITNLRVLIGSIAAVVSLIFISFIATTMVRRRNRKNVELQSLNKFKEAMTGMIAHDLKNPLSVIMNSNGNPINKRMAGQMLHLVNNMLDVQKFESAKIELKKETISFQQLFDNALSQVQPLIDQNSLLLNKKIESGLINVDHEIVERVFINLLTNAIKYSPENGEIRIESKKENNHLLISVSDQGEGIPKDKIAGIFESFEQFNPKSSGGIRSTGLGLSFVKLALEAHGANIQVDSVLGKGTSFSFQLPLLVTPEDIGKVAKSESIQLSKKEMALISQRITLLRELNVYQIGEIEKELSGLKERESESLNQWVNEVLNAAYSGNREKYDELLTEV